MDIKKFLSVLGFTENRNNIFSRVYSTGTEIAVDLSGQGRIAYPKAMIVERANIKHLMNEENMVHLSCVDRLLKLGYKPENIILEKTWPLGHREKGALDVQVLHGNGKSFLMIECKKPSEYEKEKRKMFNDGSQLFSYYQQDKDTELLCLYTSFLENAKIILAYAIVKITDNIRKASSKNEAFENWRPQYFESKGIFDIEENEGLYQLNTSKRKQHLKTLTGEDGGRIYNRFAEILRKNVVSDKTNAYNKMFNLFLCKIVDESEKKNEDVLDFQWNDNEKNEDVLLRLTNLYKKGMKEYLNLNISDVSIEDLEKELGYSNHENIKKLFIKQKLYTSNEFAFKEVFDKNTFDLNCVVVKEVVKLLEDYKIKYELKQQFLGDFFEKLLNTGIKQEAGQFFTPAPLASFICKSLLIEKIIGNKIKNSEKYFLPYVIDYASGSGHFLTEIMQEINEIVKKIKAEEIKNQNSLDLFDQTKFNMLWAKDYIYGIEKDYRLAKTTKVATYLNGDGDARIICGDALDNFYHSNEYVEKLKTQIETETDIQNFDIVVSNPPYAVNGFKTNIPNGKKSFGDLFSQFDDKSTEIEVLFIKRTKQLLKNGGVAGIILPTSLLINNKEIYTAAKKILLDNFEIKGIVKLGNNTFMATNVKTAIFFLKKRQDKSAKIRKEIEGAIQNKNDVKISNIEDAISRFLEYAYKNLKFNEYIELFNKRKFEEAMIEDKYKKIFDFYFENNNLKNDLHAIFVENEIEKMLYFIQTFNSKCIISAAPLGKEEEKEYLGYEFKDRKGHEGITISKLGGKLFSPQKINDENKINFYIRKNFDNEDIEIKEKLRELMWQKRICAMIDFNTSNFSISINVNRVFKLRATKGRMKRLKDVLTEERGYVAESGMKPYIEIGDLEKNQVFEYDIGNKRKASRKGSIRVPRNTLIISRVRPNLKKITITQEETYLNKGAFVRFKLPEEENLRSYVVEFLKQDYLYNYLASVCKDFDYPKAEERDFKNFEIPLPKDDLVLKDIMKKLQAVESKKDKKTIFESELGLIERLD